MIVALVVLSVVIVALGVAGLVLVWRLTRRPAPAVHLDRLVRESLVVTLKSGGAFDGVLWESSPRGIVLRSATALAVGGSDPIPVDGELYLFAADIAYVQKP